MNVLIAPIYNPDPILYAATRLSVEKIILIIDDNPVEMQTNSVEKIKSSFGTVLDIETVKVPKFNIFEITKKIVRIIDQESDSNQVSIDVTAGIKTVSLALTYAAYLRSNKIKDIIYSPEKHHNTSLIYLPKLSFRLTKSQREFLERIEKKNNYKLSLQELSSSVSVSKATLYNNLDELRKGSLIEETPDKMIKLTEAGRISLL